MFLPGCLAGCSAMVLGCLKLETQSTTTGLMAKHCCTASLLSMVSLLFTAVLHVLTCSCLVFQMENAQPRKPKYENGTGKKKASRLSVYIKCLSDSRLCLVARGNGIVSHRCMGPGSPAPASVANTGYVYNWPTACR